MSSHVHPYESATVDRRETRVIPIGPYAGRTVTYTLYSAMASKGYRSGYAAVPTRWFRVSLQGERPQTWTYSGKRLPLAEKHFSENLASIDDAIAKHVSEQAA